MAPDQLGRPPSVTTTSGTTSQGGKRGQPYRKMPTIDSRVSRGLFPSTQVQRQLFCKGYEQTIASHRSIFMQMMGPHCSGAPGCARPDLGTLEGCGYTHKACSFREGDKGSPGEGSPGKAPDRKRSALESETEALAGPGANQMQGFSPSKNSFAPVETVDFRPPEGMNVGGQDRKMIIKSGNNRDTNSGGFNQKLTRNSENKSGFNSESYVRKSGDPWNSNTGGHDRAMTRTPGSQRSVPKGRSNISAGEENQVDVHIIDSTHPWSSDIHSINESGDRGNEDSTWIRHHQSFPSEQGSRVKKSSSYTYQDAPNVNVIRPSNSTVSQKSSKKNRSSTNRNTESSLHNKPSSKVHRPSNEQVSYSFVQGNTNSISSLSKSYDKDLTKYYAGLMTEVPEIVVTKNSTVERHRSPLHSDADLNRADETSVISDHRANRSEASTLRSTNYKDHNSLRTSMPYDPSHLSTTRTSIPYNPSHLSPTSYRQSHSTLRPSIRSPSSFRSQSMRSSKHVSIPSPSQPSVASDRFSSTQHQSRHSGSKQSGSGQSEYFSAKSYESAPFQDGLNSEQFYDDMGCQRELQIKNMQQMYNEIQREKFSTPNKVPHVIPKAIIEEMWGAGEKKISF